MDDVVVEAQWVLEHLEDPDVVAVDVRPPHFYSQGHLPGAVNLPLFLLSSPDGSPPSADVLGQRLGSLGITRDTHVLAYDDGASPAAATLYRLLRLYNHPRVSVLDGGITAWRHAGYDWEYTQIVPQPAHYEPGERNETAASALDKVRPLLGRDNVVFLDVRSPAEYLGLTQTAQRNGHIPGAINVEWSNNLVRTDEGIVVVRPDGELREMYREAGVTPDKQVVVYCQSGGRASETYMLLQQLGYPNVQVYASGWQEWGNNPELPVEPE